MNKVFMLSIALIVSFYSCTQDNYPKYSLNNTNYSELESDTIAYEYYGTGCMHIEYNSISFFTDPSFKPQKLFSLLFHGIKSDTNYINSLALDLSKVSVTIIGHAHYDHLMDLPFIADSLPVNSTIISSKTAKNLVDTAVTQIFIDALSYAGSAIQPGSWIYDHSSKLKVLPILADHSPHLLGRVLLSDPVLKKLDKVPSSVFSWKAGQVFTYLIDFIDENGQTEKRVFFQSSTDDAPDGEVYKTWFDQDLIPIDLAIISGRGLTPNNFIKLDTKLQARKYIAVHWEKLLGSNSDDRKPGKKVAFKRMKKFIESNNLGGDILFLNPKISNIDSTQNRVI